MNVMLCSMFSFTYVILICYWRYKNSVASLSFLAHTISHTLKTYGAVSSSKTPLALICLLLRGCIYVVILLVAYYTFTHYELLSILSPFSCIMYVHLDNYS